MPSPYMHGLAFVFLPGVHVSDIRWADEVGAPSQSAVADGVFCSGQSCLPVNFQSEDTAVFPDQLNKQEPFSPKLGPLVPAISVHVL